MYFASFQTNTCCNSLQRVLLLRLECKEWLRSVRLNTYKTRARNEVDYLDGLASTDGIIKSCPGIHPQTP
jgi:hypothetical protein